MNDAVNTGSAGGTGNLSLSDAASRIDNIPANEVERDGTRDSAHDNQSAADTETEDLTDDAGLAEEQNAGEVEGEEVEVDAKAESEDDQADDQPAPQDEEREITTFAELAEDMGADMDAMMGLTATFRAHGEDVTVPISELVSSYQKDADYRQKTSQLAEQKRTHEAQREQLIQTYQNELVKLGAFAQQAQQILMGDLNSDRMQQLRTQNPVEWTAQQTEIQNRQNQINQIYAQIDQQYSATQQLNADRNSQQHQELVKAEAEKLRRAMPNVTEADQVALNNYLSKNAFSPEEVSNVVDHRLFILAHKARLYDEGKAAGVKVKRKLKQVPKFQKAGAGQPTSQAARKRSNVNKAKSKLKQSGSIHDGAAAIGALGDF